MVANIIRKNEDTNQTILNAVRFHGLGQWTPYGGIRNMTGGRRLALPERT